jgi:hypothetical protein
MQVPPATARAAIAMRDAGRAGSWMTPGAKKLDLLYVSDYETNDVYAYSYPQGKLSGVLRGVLESFVLPAGLCSDDAGDVFIPDSSSAAVLEYAHGSTHRVQTLRDREEVPYSCAVDPATGDLAVMNLESFNGPGGVAVYSGARGRPKKYAYGFVYKYYFGAYDDRGNLFVDATDDTPSEPFAFLELPKGAGSLQGVTLDQTIRVPGGVGWDGKHVTVGDSKASVIYRFAIAGSGGTKVGTTALHGARDPAQFVLAGTDVVAANFRGASVGFWNYPAGGSPAKTIGGFGEPFGVTLSFARKSR